MKPRRLHRLTIFSITGISFVWLIRAGKMRAAYLRRKREGGARARCIFKNSSVSRGRVMPPWDEPRFPCFRQLVLVLVLGMSFGFLDSTIRARVAFAGERRYRSPMPRYDAYTAQQQPPSPTQGWFITALTGSLVVHAGLAIFFNFKT